jgi:hypothetical protein
VIAANKPFINAMVQAMYKYEAKLVNQERLATDLEITEFYASYLAAMPSTHPSDNNSRNQ